MGLYLDRFWQPDGGGMSKAERMGGPYHPYLPDAIADYELLLNPSCAEAVAEAQEALAKLKPSRPPRRWSLDKDPPPKIDLPT